MKKIALIFSFLFICDLGYTQSLLSTVRELPSELKEVSGISYDSQRDMLWAINDSGNRAIVYGLNMSENQITTKVFIENEPNIDWEDLAVASENALYIADIGNNDYDRKNLRVYWLDKPQTNQKSAVEVLKTKIKIPEFESKKGKVSRDFEALIEHDGYFYLFSKTKKKNAFDGYTEVFRAAAVPGTVHAQKLFEISLCNDKKDCKITAAAYHSSSDRLALLSHKNVWVLSQFSKAINLESQELKRYKLETDTQKEAITFYNSTTLLIAEEKTKGPNYLYKLSLQHD